MDSRVTLRYTGERESVRAVPVRTWWRGDVAELKGGSSGPKDTIANQIYLLFAETPGLLYATLLVARGVPLLILTGVDRRRFDPSGRQVEMEGAV